MSFLAPWAAWFLAGLPVIVLLYLLKLKRRAVTVSTLMFWQRVMQESRRRALFQRLRNVLSLLLHLLIFLLILGALAKPTFDHFVQAGSSVVLIIDGRARMQAVEEDGESRFEKARRLASAYVRQAGGLRQVALLQAHTSPQVVVPFSADEKPLRAALDDLRPTDAGGDLESAIHFADELLASRKGAREIVVFTGSPLDLALKVRNGNMFVVPVGTRRENVAITRFASRPLLSNPETNEVLLEVRNYGSSIARGKVELSFDGKLLDVKPFEVPPGGHKLDLFPSVPRASRNARGWLTARLDADDALAVDNVAYAVLPPLQTRRVLLVSKGNWFLEKLLAADRQVSFELLAPDAFQLRMAAQFDVVMLDGVVPPGFDIAQTTGNFLFIKQSPFAAAGTALEQPLVTDLETQHPLMRLVSLQNVTVLRAQAIPLPKPEHGWTYEAPLRSFDHPLLLAGTRRASGREQRLAVLAFDVADSDLPLRIAFPLLIANTVHWLAGETTANVTSLRAGESLALNADETVTATPATPSAVVEAASAPGTEARDLFQPLHNGYYRRTAGEAADWVAVNTFSEAESDLRQAVKAPTPPSPMAASPARALATLAGWPPWIWLALGAFSLFAVEWWLFHRRRTE